MVWLFWWPAPIPKLCRSTPRVASLEQESLLSPRKFQGIWELCVRNQRQRPIYIFSIVSEMYNLLYTTHLIFFKFSLKKTWMIHGMYFSSMFLFWDLSMPIQKYPLHSIYLPPGVPLYRCTLFIWWLTCWWTFRLLLFFNITTKLSETLRHTFVHIF